MEKEKGRVIIFLKFLSKKGTKRLQKYTTAVQFLFFFFWRGDQYQLGNQVRLQYKKYVQIKNKKEEKKK